METTTRQPDGAPRRLLAVADWGLEPSRVISELRRHGGDSAQIGLLVPARLYGLDWTGDPYVSRPCAERQLLALVRIARREGLPIDHARIGDPEVVPAVDEALAQWPAEEVVLFDRRRRLAFPNPLALPRRLERSARLPVRRIEVPVADQDTGRRSPHCLPTVAPIAA